ncbi:receptor-type tyrosine-protein phosphatase eta-like, partial [Mercenaria mercenaria]|uniref:receptor-type tyrosine-protein phosphatase eta-like n=1 Tax=Mercenaria mercenaria TaxID=6596 RepID=UPI00234E4DED
PLPLADAGRIGSVTEQSFVVTWKNNQNLSYTHYHIVISPVSTSLNATCETLENGNCTLLRKNKVTSLEFEGLDPGTNYSVIIYTSVAGLISEAGTENHTYTRPLPVAVRIGNVTEQSFAVTWKDNNSLSYTHYHIVISPVSTYLNATCETLEKGNCTLLRKNNITSLEFEGLDPGTNYSVIIYTSVAGLISEAGPENHTYTKPEDVELKEVKIVKITEHSITVQMVPSLDKKCTKYRIWIANDINNSVKEIYRNETANVTKTFHNLTGGVLYTFSVIAVAGQFNSTNALVFQNYTRPNNPFRVSVIDNGETSLTAEWSTNESDTTDIIVLSISSPKFIPVHVARNGSSDGTYVFQNLTAGTKYNISVFTIIDKLYSEYPSTTISYTRPNNPFRVSVIDHGETYLTVQWSTNESHTTDIIVLSISQPKFIPVPVARKGFSNGTYVFQNLTAGTKYNISVFTIIDTLYSEYPSTTISYT